MAAVTTSLSLAGKMDHGLGQHLPPLADSIASFSLSVRSEPAHNLIAVHRSIACDTRPSFTPAPAQHSLSLESESRIRVALAYGPGPVDKTGEGAVEEVPEVEGGGGLGGAGGGGGGEGGGGGGDDEGGKSSNDGGGMSMSQKLTLLYAGVVGAGGFMGFLKSGSSKSLASGLSSAGVLVYVFTQLPANPVLASSIGLGVSVALLTVMGTRFKKSGKVMPAGVVALLAFIMSGGYVHGIFRSSYHANTV